MRPCIRFLMFNPRALESIVSVGGAEGAFIGGVIASRTPLGSGGDCRWKVSAAALDAAINLNSLGQADSSPSHCINPISMHTMIRNQAAVESGILR